MEKEWPAQTPQSRVWKDKPDPIGVKRLITPRSVGSSQIVTSSCLTPSEDTGPASQRSTGVTEQSTPRQQSSMGPPDSITHHSVTRKFITPRVSHTGRRTITPKESGDSPRATTPLLEACSPHIDPAVLHRFDGLRRFKRSGVDMATRIHQEVDEECNRLKQQVIEVSESPITSKRKYR